MNDITTGEKVCGAVLLVFLAIGVWAIFIAAGVLPAAPWSPIGKAHQQEQHQKHDAPASTSSERSI